MNSATIVQKLWNYCDVLRDDGMSYGDYVEQPTFLMFLKMANERTRLPYNQASLIPMQYAWPTLLASDSDELFDHYRPLPDELNKKEDLARRLFMSQGITFTVYSSGEGIEKIFPF